MDSKVNTLNACTVRMVSGLAFRSQRSVRVVLMSTSRLSSPWTHTYQRCVHPMTSSPHPHHHITPQQSDIVYTFLHCHPRDQQDFTRMSEGNVCVCLGICMYCYVCVCLHACMCVCIYVFMLVLMSVCVVLILYIVGVCVHVRQPLPFSSLLQR